MKLLFIIDPIATLKAYKDTSVVMMRALQARGHAIHVCEQPSLAWGPGGVVASETHIRVSADDENWYQPGETARTRLADFDAVLMRKDPPFDIEYVASTWMLTEAERQGARVINSPQAIRDHNEKFAIAEFTRFCAPSLVSRDAATLQAFVDEHRDVILKPLLGMGGTGIFRVRADDANRNVIVETLCGESAHSVMAQRFIPEIRDGDKRVLLIDGKPVPHVLARIPKAGETRGNLAAGGTGVARPISSRDREIAEALGPVYAARGLLLVGIDVIGDYLTEVNVTSPTCFREIQDQTGFDVGGMFAQAVEASVRAPRPARHG